MKTTLEIPDEVFRQCKAAAALRGESLKDFVTESLRVHLEAKAAGKTAALGWQRVFGQALPEEVAEVDAIIDDEFGTVEANSWQ